MRWVGGVEMQYSQDPHNWLSIPDGSVIKVSTCQCRRLEFDPWVGKILWRRKWKPSPVFLPGESHGQRNLVGYSPWGSQKSWTRLSD